MRRRATHRSRDHRREGIGRAGFRELIRRPAVQLLLVLTAGLQVVAVRSEARAGEQPRAIALAPVTVTQPIADATAESLAAAYREKGYKLSTELARDIHAAATDNGIDPELAFGLVRAESSFRNSATSVVGAVGLTQLMPATARWIEPGTTRSDLRDPETNLRLGFRYLRTLIDRYEGNVDLALLAYNRGPGTVDKALERGRNPDNGYAAFVRGSKNSGHKLFTR